LKRRREKWRGSFELAFAGSKRLAQVSRKFVERERVWRGKVLKLLPENEE